MLILKNPVSIIIQNNFKYKKQNINSGIVTCDVAWPCMMLAGRREKRNCFLSVFSLSGVNRGGEACIGPQEEKLINRLEVIFYQQELDRSS